MTKEWCEQKNKELATKRKEAKEKFLSEIKNTEYLDNEEKNRILQRFESDPKDYYIECVLHMANHKYLFKDDEITADKCESWARETIKFLDIFNSNPDLYFYYQDSEPKEFDGDILITDPCYFVQRDDDLNYFCLDEIGIPSAMVRDTIYGDWSCTVYDENKNELGKFCADAGLVCVANLKEVLNYNPSFSENLQASPWASTIIKNFKGTVQFVVIEEEYEYKGKKCVDYSVIVVGKGFNKVTGEPINFKGGQTGF